MGKLCWIVAETCPGSHRISESRSFGGGEFVPILLGALLLGQTQRVLGGDHFDNHDAAVVAKIEQSNAAQLVEKLTLAQLSRMPHPLRDFPSSEFLVVKTDQGNWCKLLIQAARIKRPGTDEPMELLLLERMVTYPADPRKAVQADRKEVYLFPGFAIDLDLGQIVPKDSGEDLNLALDDTGLTLHANGQAKLFAVGRPLVGESEEKKKRTFGQGAIAAADFAGQYRLEADGRWSGKVDVAVEESGNVTGSYVSDQTGQTYDITGRVGNPTNRIQFKIAFPMTEQTFEGYLWSRDRSRIAGVTHMLERPFGFVMQRTD